MGWNRAQQERQRAGGSDIRMTERGHTVEFGRKIDVRSEGLEEFEEVHDRIHRSIGRKQLRREERERTFVFSDYYYFLIQRSYKYQLKQLNIKLTVKVYLSAQILTVIFIIPQLKHSTIIIYIK